MAEKISFTDWLITALRDKKMTQSELATKAGLGKSVINKLVNRMTKRPDARTYVAIAKALDVSPITVLRIVGILPPDPELPELEDFKVVLAQLSPEKRAVGLDLIRTLVKYEKK